MPISTAVIQVEGVLRKTVTRAPLDMGKRLYHGLAGVYNLVLVTEDTDKERMKTWLAMEGFDKHAHVEFSYAGFNDTYWSITAKHLRIQYGYNVEYVVQPDPVTATRLIADGFNSLLVSNAAYALPEWRPEPRGDVQPWAALADEVDAQRALRAADKRMEGH